MTLRASADDAREDRGQLLLVGAVAIAIVLLGLVVVFNTVLFTETRAPDSALKNTGEARSLTDQVENDTGMILYRVADETGSTTTDWKCTSAVPPPNFCDYVTWNVSNYSRMLGTSYSHTGPVYVSVELKNVAGTASLTGCPSSITDSTKLCAEVEIVFETNNFEYSKTITVVRDPP